MRNRIVHLFVVLAILCGGLAMSTDGRAKDMSLPHGGVVAAEVEHFVGADHGDDHDQGGDSPCHAVNHHHCSLALAVVSPALNLAFVVESARRIPLEISALRSLARAPPVEPPAA